MTLEPLQFEIRSVRGGPRAYPTNEAAKHFVAVLDQVTLTLQQLREFAAVVPILVTSAIEGYTGFLHK